MVFGFIGKMFKSEVDDFAFFDLVEFFEGNWAIFESFIDLWVEAAEKLA